LADYINASQFTKLFRNRKKHHHEICATLYTLVTNLVMRSLHTFHGKAAPTSLTSIKRPSLLFDDDETRLDAIQTTVLYCIERIDRFNHKRKDANAFSYYTTVALNALRKCQREQGRPYPLSIDDLELMRSEFDEEAT
jgi:hypothetical protein